MADLPDPDGDPGVWRQRLGLPPESSPAFLVLAEPFSLNAAALLAGLDAAYPDARKAGGLASGGRSPGANALFLGGDARRQGAVGVALSGAVALETIVAQGCRPIGKPMLVTRAQKNLILEVDGRPPTEA